MMLPAGPGIKLTTEEIEVLKAFVDMNPLHTVDPSTVLAPTRDIVRKMLLASLDGVRGWRLAAEKDPRSVTIGWHTAENHLVFTVDGAAWGRVLLGRVRWFTEDPATGETLSSGKHDTVLGAQIALLAQLLYMSATNSCYVAVDATMAELKFLENRQEAQIAADIEDADHPDADPTVNHPAHYGGEDNPFEVVKVLEAWLTPEELLGWLKGSAIKYLARMGKKDGQPAARDAAKAEWYANRIKETNK